MKRILLGIVVLLLVGGGGLLGLWLHFGQPYRSELEQWIGRRLVGVLQAYVVPEMEFERLDYQEPFTVVLDNVTLRAEGETLVAVEQLRLELAEIPRIGQPIQIRDVTLTGPKLRLIQRSDGTLIGWQPFVRGSVRKDPNSVPRGQRLSDILVLRHVEIHNGEVVLRSSDPAKPAMSLPGVNLTIKTAPDTDAPGWYTIAGAFQRDPVFRIDLDARLNIDTAVVDVKSAKLDVALGEQTYGSLPANLQQTLREHKVRGALHAECAGVFPLHDTTQAAGQLTARLEDAHLVFSGTTTHAGECQLKLATTEPNDPALATGTLKVDKARLVELPLLSHIRAVVARMAQIVNLPPRDRASFEFTLQPDHVALAKSEVVTAVMAMRATGKVYYDGRLDLLVNAGAMEKVQAELGPIGKLFGKLSDRLIQYQVTGHIGQPKITVCPLGG